jgi:hypothetical protein
MFFAIPLLIIAALAAYVALQPAAVHITRSALIAAAPETIFAQVNDFHNWGAWSPWAKLDPAAKNSFEGVTSGVGAGFRWDGNNHVGAGVMTIVESRPSDLIRIRLEFVRPFVATSTAEFTFVPEDGETRVTWSFVGTNGFIGKAVNLVMNCDKMVGDMYAQGLANIKAIVAPR